MVIELRALSYEDRLKKLGLTTLEVRRKRCDLIQIYKIKNGIEEVDIDIRGGNQGGYQGRRHDQQKHKLIRYKLIRCSLMNYTRTFTVLQLLPLNTKLYLELSAYQSLTELFLEFFFKLIQIIKNDKIF